MVPVQLRKSVHETGQGELSVSRVVIKGDFRSIRPEVDTSSRVTKSQGLFAGRHVEAHEQLTDSVDVENISHISKTSGLTKLALPCTEKNYILNEHR